MFYECSNLRYENNGKIKKKLVNLSYSYKECTDEILMELNTEEVTAFTWIHFGNWAFITEDIKPRNSCLFDSLRAMQIEINLASRCVSHKGATL